MNAIVEGLRRLADFRGRSSPDRFWFYAMAVLFVTFMAGWLAMAPLVTQMIAESMAFAAANPDQATVTSSGAGQVTVQIHDAEGFALPDMGGFFLRLGIVAGVTALLLAAAVTRRLHDTGRSGWWGLPPLVFLMIGLIMFPKVMEAFMSAADEGADADFPLTFLLLFGNNVLYMLSLAGLVVLLVLRGEKGANRYGPEPS